MPGSDITIAILKDIREGVRETNSRLDRTNARLASMEHALSQRLDGVTERLDLVETTLLDLAAQHRVLMRYTRTTAERESRLEPRVSALESRVGKLESK